MTTRLLTAAEVAAMLGVPRSWVYERLRQGLIPTVELGRYRRFRQEAIAGMVEGLERGPRPPGADAALGSDGVLTWLGAATAAAHSSSARTRTGPRPGTASGARGADA